MKKIFLFLSALIPFLSITERVFGADNFVKIKDISRIECTVDANRIRKPFQIIKIDPKKNQLLAVLYYDLNPNSYGQIRMRKCNLALMQAEDEGSGVYINLESGEVIPENGFFVQQKPNN